MPRFFSGGGAGKKQAGEYLRAILLGKREGLSKEMTWDLRTSGVYHILAISGLHVGILLTGLYLLFRIMKFKEILSNILVIVISFLYAGVAGFSPSVTRAFIMAAFLVSGRILQRDISLWNSLSASAALILLFRSSDIFQTGFQLAGRPSIDETACQPMRVNLVMVAAMAR